MTMIACGFCRGTGKDPFNLLSELAACQVCGGRGKVEVKAPAIKCIYCDGTGVYPHNARITCTVCNGKGMVTVSTGGGSLAGLGQAARGGKGAAKKCRKCKGTGKAAHSGLPCTECGGKGVISKKK